HRLLLSAHPPCERDPQWARTATPSVWVLLCGGSMAESLKSNGSPQRRTHRTGDRRRCNEGSQRAVWVSWPPVFCCWRGASSPRMIRGSPGGDTTAEATSGEGASSGSLSAGQPAPAEALAWYACALVA